MDKDFIIRNWNDFYKSYAKLNSDLQISGINTKRSLLNHYVKYGFNENRRVVDDQENIRVIDNQENSISQPQNNSSKFILNDTMIIEKL
jgi:hypothetical protein